jgi:hypothetical protein
MTATITRRLNPCRPRKSVIYSSLWIAAAFVVVSTQVRVERTGNHHLRIHFPTSFAAVLKATAEFLDQQSTSKEISL